MWTVLIVLALVVSASAGAAYGGYKLVTSPAMWGTFAAAIVRSLEPMLQEMFRRKTEAEEAEDRERVRQGLPSKPKWHEGENR